MDTGRENRPRAAMPWIATIVESIDIEFARPDHTSKHGDTAEYWDEDEEGWIRDEVGEDDEGQGTQCRSTD